MSSTRRSRNNMEKGVLSLNDDEIQEELLNADLKAHGFNEDLSSVKTQEKINLLAVIKQSTSSPQQLSHTPCQNSQASIANNDEPASCDNSPNRVSNPDKSEISISVDSPEEYPSLPSTSSNSKRCNQSKRFQQTQLRQYQQQHRLQQQLHRQQNQSQEQQQQQQRLPQQVKPKSEQPITVVTINSNQEESEDDDDDDDDDDEDEDVEEYISDDEDQLFNFPGFVDDNGPNLSQRARKKPFCRNVHYYTLPGQANRDAIKSMLKYYNSWYKVWCSLEKHNILLEDNDFVINSPKQNNLIKQNNSLPSTSSETCVSYSTKINNDTRHNEKPAFEKSSSPDVEEVEITEIRTQELSRIPNAKAKTLPRETRGQNAQTPSSSSTPTIALNFEEKWDPESGQWVSPRRGRKNLSKNNHEAHVEPKMSPKVEAKVQCPICQLDFLQSKIEHHAAICEGFPSETRANQPSYPSKNEDSNSKDGLSTMAELNNSDPKITNKKRVAEKNEDLKTNKRVCVNRI